MTDRRAKLAAIPIHERFLLDEETASIMCEVSLETYRQWVAAGIFAPVDLPVRRNLYSREELLERIRKLPRRGRTTEEETS